MRLGNFSNHQRWVVATNSSSTDFNVAHRASAFVPKSWGFDKLANASGKHFPSGFSGKDRAMRISYHDRGLSSPVIEIGHGHPHG